jgi:hypothetical protein
MKSDSLVIAYSELVECVSLIKEVVLVKCNNKGEAEFLLCCRRACNPLELYSKCSEVAALTPVS